MARETRAPRHGEGYAETAFRNIEIVARRTEAKLVTQLAALGKEA